MRSCRFRAGRSARQRHLQYYLDLADTFEKGIRGQTSPHPGAAGAELDNLRLALAWSLEEKAAGMEPELGLRLCSSLVSFWSRQGREDEAIQWLELLLAGEAEARGSKSLPRANSGSCRALQVASYLAWHILIKPKPPAGHPKPRPVPVLGAEGRVGYARACFVYDDPSSDRTRRKDPGGRGDPA